MAIEPDERDVQVADLRRRLARALWALRGEAAEMAVGKPTGVPRRFWEHSSLLAERNELAKRRKDRTHAR